MAERLPATPAEWEVAYAEARMSSAEQANVSASKIHKKQFLRLRVLWDVSEDSRKRSTDFFEQSQSHLMTSCGFLWQELVKVRQELKDVRPWQEYLEHLKNPRLRNLDNYPDLGAFALVDSHRREVKELTQKPQNDEGDPSEGTRLAPRTYNLRARNLNISYKIPSDSPEHRPSTPTSGSSSSSKYPPSPSERARHGPPVRKMEILELEPGTVTMTPFPPRSADTGGLSSMFPRARDEQIVNTALIDLVKSITLYLPYAARWTLLRKAFRYDDWEARVDGCLEAYTGAEDQPVKAIVEVKACSRSFSPHRIRMQEGAQMVAWIASDKDEVGCKILEDGRRRRVLISQDRHEIFVTIATYRKDYRDYLVRSQKQNEERRARQKKRRKDMGERIAARERDLEARKEELKKVTFMKKMTPSKGKGKEKEKEKEMEEQTERMIERERELERERYQMEENAEGPSDDDPFLKMFEIGPFNTNHFKEVDFFGRIIMLIVADTCPGMDAGLGYPYSSSSGPSPYPSRSPSGRRERQDPRSAYNSGADIRGITSDMSRLGLQLSSHSSHSSDYRQTQSRQRYPTPPHSTRQQHVAPQNYSSGEKFDTRQQPSELSRYGKHPQSGEHLRYEHPQHGQLSHSSQYSQSTQYPRPGQPLQSGQHQQPEPLPRVRPQFESQLQYHPTSRPVIPPSYQATSHGLREALDYQHPVYV